MQFDELQKPVESKVVSFEDGYLDARITSVKKFANFAVKNFVAPEFVFRGQSNGDKWSLQPTFQRLSPDRIGSEADLLSHLRLFRHAARGRRGNNPRDLKDDEWWALGQHYGLATPLLDWTRSYWVALYFAFSDSQAESLTQVNSSAADS